MALILGLLIPLLGTMLGASFVFLMKDAMSARLQKTLLGFASGVMVAASVWSLLIPAIEMEDGRGAWAVVPAAVGFLLGMGFLLLLDELTPHLHLGSSHVLRRCRGTHPRSLRGPALQPQHHRFRHWLRPHDGTRCRLGMTSAF